MTPAARLAAAAEKIRGAEREPGVLTRAERLEHLGFRDPDMALAMASLIEYVGRYSPLASAERAVALVVADLILGGE